MAVSAVSAPVDELVPGELSDTRLDAPAQSHSAYIASPSRRTEPVPSVLSCLGKLLPMILMAQVFETPFLGATFSVDLTGACKYIDPIMFAGITLSPGDSLADTAAQKGVSGLNSFRQLEQALFKHGVKCVRLEKEGAAMGIGGPASVLGLVHAPVAIAGVNCVLELTIVDHPAPTLTPISLLRALGAVVDVPDEQMILKHRGSVKTRLTTQPSGHVSHSLLEFPQGGWRSDDRVQHDRHTVAPHEQFEPIDFAPKNSKTFRGVDAASERKSRVHSHFSSNTTYVPSVGRHFRIRTDNNRVYAVSTQCPGDSNT